LHRDVVQQEGESDSDDDRVLQPLHDTSLVELFDDDCGSDLFPLDPVVGEYYVARKWLVPGEGMRMTLRPGWLTFLFGAQPSGGLRVGSHEEPSENDEW
jgi:hypothetical protein